MALSEEILALIEEEEKVLGSILASLEAQRRSAVARLYSQSSRAIDLAEDLMSARREEDKQLLASDEAVARGLKERKEDETKGLEKLLDSPYFARVVFEEEDERGNTQRREIRLGRISNIECRIIDWKKAPLAKLFYEYKEGETFIEEIQGRDRSGIITLKNKVDIEKGQLVSLTCRHGTFTRGEDGWAESENRRVSGGGRKLPDILSLITAEQYKLITEEADTGLLLQGVAGSGKTTVALYRLQWLLENTTPKIQPHEVLIITRGFPLKRYIEESLSGFGLEEAVVTTYDEWGTGILNALGLLTTRRELPCPEPSQTVRRVMSSHALLLTFEEARKRPLPLPLTTHAPNPLATPELAPSTLQETFALVRRALSKHDFLLSKDISNLLDRPSLQDALHWLETVERSGSFDELIEPFLFRIATERWGGVPLPRGSKGRFGHVVIDETQDFSSPELLPLLSIAENPSAITLVGDTSQQLAVGGSFPGWEVVKDALLTGKVDTRFTTLSISHRSTVPIMRLAEHVQRRPLPTEGRQGRVPIWFMCDNESLGIPEAIGWLKRVAEKFPHDLIAVLTATPSEAQLVESFLTPTFGGSVRRGDASSFTFDEGIVVTSISESKGLEFPSVLIWNPSAKKFPKTDLARNHLYVAITRAEERLGIVTWGERSPLLPSPFSSLVRLYEIKVEVEDDEPNPLLERGR